MRGEQGGHKGNGGGEKVFEHMAENRREAPWWGAGQ